MSSKMDEGALDEVCLDSQPQPTVNTSLESVGDSDAQVVKIRLKVPSSVPTVDGYFDTANRLDEIMVELDGSDPVAVLRSALPVYNLLKANRLSKSAMTLDLRQTGISQAAK